MIEFQKTCMWGQKANKNTSELSLLSFMCKPQYSFSLKCAISSALVVIVSYNSLSSSLTEIKHCFLACFSHCCPDFLVKDILIVTQEFLD